MRSAARSSTKVLVVSVGGANDRVYGANGKAETHYRPDPAGPALLASLASATGGRVSTGAAAASARLRTLAGTGPTTAATARERQDTTLAPFLALAALVLRSCSLHGFARAEPLP